MPAETLESILAAHNNDIEGYYQAINKCSGASRLFWDTQLRAWIVTGYTECVSILQNGVLLRNRVSLPRTVANEDLVDFAERVLKAQMMFLDSPVAEARRCFWTRFLGPSEKDHSVLMSSVATSFLGECESSERFDAYSRVLQPYVAKVVCEVLGIEESVHRQLYPMILQYVRFLDGRLRSNEDLLLALYSIVKLYASLAAGRATNGEAYESHHDWVSDYLLTLVAGHESTAYLLGSVFLHGEKWLEAARVDKRQLMRIVHEAVRFDSPVQMIGRYISVNLQINGEEFRAGERVFLHIGAANRDDREFDCPGTFDPSRKEFGHLGFGVGRSHCVGAALSVEMALQFLMTLATRGECLRIEKTNVKWDNGLAGRAFRELPTRVEHIGINSRPDDSSEAPLHD